MKPGKTNLSEEIRPDREYPAVGRAWLNRRDAKNAEAVNHGADEQSRKFGWVLCQSLHAK